MGWNGSGVVTRTDGTRSGATVWAQAKAAAVRIRTDGHDTHDEDLAGAIERCWNIDGENALAASVDAGGFNINNLAAGTLTGDAVAYGQSTFKLVSTDTGADAKPTLTLHRNSATPAASDDLGVITWNGEDSASNEQFYGSIKVQIADATSGSEDSRMLFSTMVDGTERIGFRIAAGSTYQFSGFDAGAAAGPVVTLHRESSSPEDGDVLGAINFDGEDSGSAQTTFASITAVADDITDSTEDGHFKVQAVRAGAMVTCTAPGVLQGVQASTSGTTVNFTNIHADARRITVMFMGVSTSGTSNILIQIGGSVASYATSGYVSGAGEGGSSVGNGFLVFETAVAAHAIFGAITLTLANPALNYWVAAGAVNTSGGGSGAVSGAIELNAVVDRLRITMANGTDTFDLGNINVMVE